MTGPALGWGFAEATLFFVIPDVLLTYVAVRHGFARAGRAAAWATAGAVAGGLLMWCWGKGAVPAMLALPAIDDALVAAARTGVAGEGSAALVGGAFQGVPYKLYAAAAGELGADPVGLAAWTVVGRMNRFLVAITVAAGVARLLAVRLPERAITALWAAFWVAVYASYWI